MTTPEPVSTYLPDVWEAAHWLRNMLTEGMRRSGDEHGTRLIEAQISIVDLFIDANRNVTHYAGPEILHALAGPIEALSYAYSDLPGYNPHWSFE